MAKSGLAQVQAQYVDAIREGMARTLWLTAYTDWADEHADDDASEIDRPGGGEDWDDFAPDTPPAAEMAARDLSDLYAAANAMTIADLFELAMVTEYGRPFDWTEKVPRRRHHRNDEATEFGHDLAMMALGHGVSWFDDHKEFPFEQVHFECYLGSDGGGAIASAELTWSGGSSGEVNLVGETTGGNVGTLININYNDRDWTRHRYVLWFGAYGTTRLIVHANSLDDALDEAIDWLVDNEPGHIVDDQVHAAYNAAIAAGKSEDKAMEEAESDTTTGGNAGNHILSHEWGIVAEDPTNAELREIGGLTPNAARPRRANASR